MNHKRRLVLLSCVGSILEYYDFIIYGMMAIYLSEIFFAANTPEMKYLQTFSVVSVGYLTRPIGGYAFGAIADIYGRKKTLILVMATMAVATLMIGLLPTYAQIGIWSPILLTLARVLQGLSFGAEMPSLAAIIKESTEEKQSGKYFGLVMSSTGFGALLASLMVFLLGRYFTANEMMDWAWRIPFLFGAIFALFVLVIRNRLIETPAFLESKMNADLHASSRNIAKDLCMNHWPRLLCGMSLTLFFSYLILLSLYLPVYLNQYFGYPKDAIFSAITAGMLVSVFMSPIFGYVFDRMNRARVVQVFALGFVLFLWGCLQVLKQEIPYLLVCFFLAYQFFISAYATNLLSLLPDVFPLHIRATGIGVCYNVAYAVASLILVRLTSVIRADNHEWVLMGFSVCIVAVSVCGSLFLKRQTGQSQNLQVKTAPLT